MSDSNTPVTLDPQVAALMQMQAAANLPPMESLPPEIVRQGFRMQSTMTAAPPAEMASVVNQLIPGDEQELPIRIYRPITDGDALLPILVYYHGGGWVICDLDTHDDVCRTLAVEGECIVVSVDYRLAPEHPYPAAVDDSWAALLWVAENGPSIGGDNERIAVGGDSAGGNLAAVMAYMARNQGGPELALQLLIYPVVDLTEMNRDSYLQFAEDHGLTKAAMNWFKELYLPPQQDASDPHISPLCATDLTGLPPAIVMTAEADVLRDEGEAYAELLKAAGNHVEHKRYNGMVHGFFSMAGVVEVGMQARKDAGQALKKFFN